MPRYINADELIKEAEKEGAYGYVSAEQIADFPTAEVTEVKHGEWMFKFYCGNMSGYDYGMSCSVCKKPTYRQFAEKMPNYCPNCGALMMDEVKE